MAKTGFWLRGAQGKLAGAAIQKGSDGETIIREVVTPSNPKTKKQMIQRIIVSTVGHAYSVMKEITDHSFEGNARGMANMRQFMAYNTAVLRDKVVTSVNAGLSLYEIYDSSYVGGKIFAINPYTVSRPSLPGIQVAATSEDSAFGFQVPLSASTSQAIIGDYGLLRADRLTFISISPDAVGRGYTFSFARVILDPTDANGDSLPLSTAFASGNAVDMPSVRSEASSVSILYAGNSLQATVGSANAAAACVIVSRQKADGTFRYSDTELTVLTETSSDGFTLGEALDNSDKASFSTESEVCLNNAGTGSYISSDNTANASGSSAGGSETGGGGTGGDTGGGNTGDQLPRQSWTAVTRR